uniref:NADH-ubiquinone oxidoreductase chain 3 n=2 Tax=Physopelta TaxID=209985 RepID=B7SML1_9HEMI|nr:NADH dehydrogenase subunit 3 [Physopelta gutta]YP_009643421.1 NADH dehydrogenase subunit 3 [Physopelta cincticollis]ABZ02105.1 NADH dehydrogenase subunit 3 [Physopelta gutta]APO08852.1 NADH dehydrogenase subunit 3 [Physopelta cincticollis]
MMKVMISMIMAGTLTVVLMTLCTIISKKSIMSREKMSPFECGFDPKSTARLPFSLQFFLIAVLFLIFDVEIVIILPMIITLKMSNMMTWMMTVTMFMMILITGLFYEWKNGMLEWKY